MSGPEIIFEKDKDLTKLSTMRLKARGDLYTVKSVPALRKLLKKLSLLKKNYIVLGMGANQLLRESSQIPYIKLSFPFDFSYLETCREEYLLPASILLNKLTSHAMKFNLSGWEYFTGIPATLGGAIFMNGGTNLGEIGTLVKNFSVVTREGILKMIEVDQTTFSYRKNNKLNPGDIIVSATLVHHGVDESIASTISHYLKIRNAGQPLRAYTCGCLFKNIKGPRPCRVGLSLDLLGLKGLQHKNIKVSEKHANFMENIGPGTYTEVIELIEKIKKELELQLGVDFETEVKL